MEPSQPRGVRDIGPVEATTRRNIIAVIEETFKRFGFYLLDTPAIENLSVLNAKGTGDDAHKEIYTIAGEDTALRFDLTVPLARYVAMNKNINLPFKRYQIGNVWRKEEPQKMRYREFLQFDIDIVGGAEILSDAEVVAGAATAIEQLQISNALILINSRKILEAVLSYFGVGEDRKVRAIRLIDKMSKQSVDEIVRQLTDLGIDQKRAYDLVTFISTPGSNDEKITRLKKEIPESKADAEAIEKLLDCISKYGLKSGVKFDLSLARGLDYYTGFVWEIVVETGKSRLPSIAAGGRYDGLIGAYSKRDIQATGISMGLDRIFDMLYTGDKSFFSMNRIYLAFLTKADYEYSVGVAMSLRSEGLYVDLNSTERNLAKQLEYANALGFPNVIIIGEQERSKKKLKLKNLTSGKEDILSLEEAIKILKK